MGSISGSGNAATSAGFDLSGTTVSTTCDKKIAVFGGNGRCMVTTPTTCTAPTSGSDNLVQQMIPSVAWGTLYYAVPTKTMEVNLFRVYDRIAGTVVKVNGVTLNPATQYNNVGHFYFFETNQPSVITADNPISVTQFVIAGNCATTGSASANGMNGKGDPEMIILSAAQQSITKVTMYAPPFANGASGGSYINVVIPQSGISTFSLDNIPPLTGTVDTGQSSYTANTYGASGAVTLANAFHTFAADPTYAWAKFKVTSPANHTLSSSVGFNAIAYGMDAGESYGFNAGTSVKNLSSIKIIENPHGTDTSSTAVRTCKDNPVTLQIALPHLPALVDSIVWGNTGTPDPRVTPAGLHTGPISGGHATYTGTTTVDGITYYIYTSPVQYTFSQLGTYVINATAYGTFASDCPGQDIQKITVIVGRDNVTPSYTSNCGSPNVTFTNGTIPMAGTTITTAIWNFGDGQLDTTLNPTEIHTYATNTTFNATLTTINSIGCFSKDSVQVDFSGGVHALFSVTPQHTVCAGTTITFDPSASNITGNTSGTPVKWTWNFGEGAPVVINGSTSPVQTHTYNNPGTYIDSLIMESSTGCKNVYKDTIYVQATPIAAFGPAALHTCAGTSFSFTDLSTPAATIGGWHWDFGDPASGTNDSSAAQNPTHIFTTPGSYVVSLNVTTSAGCPSLLPVTQHTITVDSLPTASFTTLTNCAAKTVTFTDHSNGHGGTIVNWVWNFGDGSPDSTVHNNNPITHAYPAGGSHPVTLSVTTANGCTSSVVFQQTIGFGATPVASFSLPSGNLCLPNALATFTNTSTISDGTLMTYVWDFGDGIHAAGDTLSVAAAPASITHTFNGVGPYTITLTATSNQGCPNAVSQQLDTVYAQPLAVITQPAHVCFGSSGSFSAANSNFYNGIAADWVWDFGDGTPLVHQQSPSHTFNNTPPGPGLYHVHLYVTSVAGCTSVTKDTTIRIDSLPTANFTTSIDCSHRIATFTDASLGNGNAIQTWSWNFGDPASGPTNNVSSLPSPVHTFTAAGVPYPVTLTVTTANGCSNTIPYSQTINIHSAPFVNFTLPGNTCLPAANGTFINTSSINDGTLMTYVWNFGDGPSASTDSILTPAAPAPIAHTYNNVGPFIVKLTATSAFGCVHDTSITYNGIYAQPIAVIAEPTEICFGNSASFSANSSFALNSSLTNWVWNFGDGSPSIDQLNPTHAFNNTPPGAGTFHVTLTVTSATGCVSATKDTTIKVDSLPIASFTLPATRCANNSFTFIDNSQANAGATGTITEWHWNFGDGSAPVVLTSGGSTSHTYAVAGTYSVSLWIKNSNGCTSAIYLNNAVVVNPLPVPNFTAQANCSLVTGSMVFTAANNTVANVASWNWNFGTTPTSTGSGQFTTNAYILGGTYNVQLVEITTAGCTDSITLPIPVVSTPTAKDSIINEGNLCSSQPVTVINESVVAGFGNVTKVLVYWDWLNNQSIVTQDTLPQLGNSYVHSYPTFGTPDTVKYTITLIAYNVNGCSDTIQKVINLKASPKIGFNNAAFPNTICQEKPALDIVDSLSATPMAYDIFHLGSYSGIHVSGTGIEIGNTYFNPALAQLGANSITFSDTALNGCYTDTSRDIVVLPTPQITFAPSYAVEEGYSIVPLKPTTPMAPNLIYHWSPATFLNDTTLSTPDVLLPSQDMIYTLQVQSLTGCTATQDIAVNLLTDFPVYNTFTPNGLGTNNTWVIPRIALYPNHHVEVFNRYGQLVFESRNYTPWDGTYKGKTLPEGTYYYIIELGGVRKPKTGYVTIIK